MGGLFWDRTERFFASPVPVLLLFFLTLLSIFHLLIFGPILKDSGNKVLANTSLLFSSDTDYVLGDLATKSDGTYDLKTANENQWPTFATWQDSDTLIRVAKSQIVWLRVDGVDLSSIVEPFTLLAHNGAFFEVYNDSGRLLFRYGDLNREEELPRLLDTEYSWVPLGKEPMKYCYLRIFHRKGHLFGINSVQNRIGSKTDILTNFAKSNLLSLYLHSFFFFIGLICALVYLTQYKKKYFTLLDFSIFTFIIGTLGFSTNDYIRYLSDDRYSLYLISTICANIVYIPMHSGLRRLFGSGKFNLLSVLILANVVIASLNIILGFSINQYPEVMNLILRLRIFYLIFALTNFLGPIVVAYFAWKKGSEIGLEHVVGFSLTLILVLIEIYLSFRDQTSFNRVAYWGVFFGVFAQGLALEKLFFSNRQKMNQYEASLLITEKSLREVQLKTLQTKLSPHYLFNSLNTIHALQQTKSDLVGDAILRLANNYRFLSDKTELSLIPFNEEWEFIEDFLHLQKLRFYDTVKIHLTKEGDFNGVLIPPLILQPIVENSFKHGFRNASSRNWMIDIHAKIDAHSILTLKIADTGSGIADDVLQNDSLLWGRSLGNIKKRLSHHFEYAKVTIARNNPSGIVTTLILEKIISQHLTLSNDLPK